jgi:hypothetical protein
MYRLFFLSLLLTVFLLKDGYTSYSRAPISPPAAEASAGTPLGEFSRRKKAQKEFEESLSQTRKMATAPQFSGAIQWAHRQGIKGQGKTAVILEQSTASPALLKRMGPLLMPSNLGYDYPPFGKETHATRVIDAFSQVAPKSQVVLLDMKNENEILELNGLREPSNPKHFYEAVSDASVINRSWGNMWRSKTPLNFNVKSKPDRRKLVHSIKDLMKNGKPKLLFQSAGNEGVFLSDDRGTLDSYTYPKISNGIIEDPFLKTRLIIVGSVGHSNGLARKEQPPSNPNTTNKPGGNKTLQDTFLFTLGDKVRLMDGTSIRPGTGTSFASPIAAGCALLLMERYPTLSVESIREALLESASRNFYIDYKKNRNGKLSGLFVYDEEDGKPDITTFSDRSKYIIEARPFNPAVYGKGILDLRAAFIYAGLKLKNKRLSPKQLRQEMKIILKKQNAGAATKIQSAFRSKKNRKAFQELPFSL